MKKRIIFWILLFVFLISCVSIPAFAEDQNPEEKEKNLHQTDNYQETPTEDIKNPAGIKSNRTNYFLEEDKEDEIDLILLTKKIMESNNDNPLIYNILKKKGKLYLLDKFKALGKNNKLQQEKTATEQIKEETAEDKEKPVQDNINKDTSEQENKELDKPDQVDTKVETETELEQELMNIIAQASQDEAWYNTLIGPSTINGIKENKYSAWEDTGEIVSPQTGALTLKINDITLPGRNGLDINLGRIYQSNQALLGDYRLSIYDKYHNDFSTYYQNRYNLGAGWALTLPSVQVEQDVIYMGSDQTELYYHTGNGDIYHVNFTPDPNDSNLDDYYKKDGVFKQDTSFSYQDGAGGSQQESIVSQYVYETADKTKQYFAKDGRLMAIVDRFDNQIIFKHNLLPVTNRIVNYDFDDTTELTPGVAWDFDTDYFLKKANYGKDDNTSLAFCRNPSLSAVDASAFSKRTKVLPDTKYYISGYLATSLNTGSAIAKINQYEVGLNQYGYFMEEIPNSEIEIALLNGYHPWEKFETIFTTHTDANYIEIEFYNENAKGMSFLDKVRLDRAWPIITEITDSIGRKITFNYVDNFYEEDEDTYNHNPITVTIQDPALQNNVDFTYDREVLKTSMTYKYNNQNYIGNRRYPSHNGFDDGETYYKYSYNNRACEFSYTHKNTSGDYGMTHQHLLKSLYLRNSKVDYVFYEKNYKHMGEEGFYTNSRVTSRDEKYYVNETIDEGGHYSRNYSYNGYYNGNHYTNETGYSNEYYSSHTLPKNPDFQWISTIQQNNGLKTETYFKGSPIGLREEKEITYHSDGEKETRYFEEYDTTFPNQVTKIKTARQNTEGINTYYTGYSYNDWGGLASEIQPLTPDQWNNAAIKSQNTISYSYDPVYKLPAGKTYYQNPTTQLTESTTYNNKGAVLTTTNAKGETTNYTYGDIAHPGNCTKITANLESGKQEITEINYSGAYYAFPTTITKKYTENGINKNSTTTQGYEYIRGNVINETDATGNRTQYEYDSQGRIKKTTYPIATGKDGQYTVRDNYQYANYTLVLPEYQGRQVFRVYKTTTKTISNQSPEVIAKSSNYYDDNGNLLTSEYWDNDRGIWVRTKYKYDNYGQLIWSKDAQNRQTSYLIDEWGRLKTITDPQGNKYQYTYNIYRNTKNTSFLPYTGAAENHYTETYDQRDRIISRKGYPNGSGGTAIEEKYEYDQLDNITKITDARNKNTRYQYDALGNLTKTINALNEQIDYEYNKQSKLSKIKQYQGTQSFQTQKTYDERGAQISAQRPSGSPVTYKNNALGMPIQVTDASNKTTSISYDRHNRLFETTANHDGISRYYHPIGEIEKYTVWNDTSGTRIYGEGLEYNLSNTGQIKERKSGNYSVSFQNDISGNTTKITDPFNLAINYTYDNLNRLNNVTAEGKTFHYEYYPDGMLKAVNYPPTPGGLAIRSEYTYDNLNRLKTVINKVGNGYISQYSYIYDSNGNIISVNTNGSTTQYQYDNLNRLTGITRPNGEQITYNYDTRGNRTKLLVNNAGAHNAISGTFSYNNWDELAQFTTGGRTYQYKYDPESLRTKKESTTGTIRYHLDNNGQVIAESNANGQVTAQNIWGHKALARKVNGAYYYYIYNGHGDVIQVLNTNGNIVNSYTYDEWGNILSKTEQISNPIRYAGEYYDEESGLYYLRARYYDPVIGRFISEDSNEGEINNPLSLNLYTYCENDPVNYIDPDGNAKLPNELLYKAGMYVSVGSVMVYNYAQNKVYDITSKTIQMLNYTRPITIKGIKSVWKLNPVQRGNIIEKALGGWCNNFPVIDKAGRIVNSYRTSITSIKSIDLFAKSYKKGNKVYSKIMSYAKSLKTFSTIRWGDKMIKVNSSTKRILELAIPKNASTTQMNQIYQAIKDAAKMGIKIKIKYIK